MSRGEVDNSSAFELLKTAGQSALHAGLQTPMDAVVQIGAAATGKNFEAPKLIEAPKPAEFGSAAWYAQTVGAGVGMVAPFIASEAIVGKVAKFHSPIGRSATSGAFYGLVFTPSQDSEGNFVSDRLKNATVGGITFGTQRAATLGVTAGAHRLTTSGFEAARQNATSLTSMSRIGTIQSSLAHPFLSGTSRISANAFGGAIAGGVNANAYSLLSEGRMATGEETAQSVAAFVVTGGALDAVHMAGGRLATRKQQTNGEKAGVTEASVTEKVETKSSGSGDLADVHKRLTEGSEAAREGQLKPNSTMVEQASTQLSDNIKRVLGIRPEKQLSDYNSTRDLHKFIEQLKTREHDIEGANLNEVTRALRAVDSLVTADKLTVPLSRSERLALAKQILFEAANPKHIGTGEGPTSPVLAMDQSISYWNPGRYAESVVSVITTGKYRSPGNDPVEIDLSPALLAKAPPEFRSTLAPNAESRQSLTKALTDGYKQGAEPSYSGQLAEVLGVNLLTQTNPNGKAIYLRNTEGEGRLFEQNQRGELRMLNETLPPLEPAHLMRLFDLKTGVHKPEMTLKKPIGSHFGIVDRTGNMKIIANDTVWADLGTQIDGKSPVVTDKQNNNYYGVLGLRNKGDAKLPEGAVRLTEEVLPTDHGFSKQVTVENTLDRSITISVAEKLKPRVEDIFPGERGWVGAEPLPAQLQQARITESGRSVDFTYTQVERPPQFKLEGGVPENNYRMQFSATDAISGSGNVARPRVDPSGAKYVLTLAPGEAHTYQVDVRTAVNRPISELGDVQPFTQAKNVASEAFHNWIESGTQVRFGSKEAAAMFNRSQGDIATLMIPTEHGPILAAGVPEFVTIFGRDSKTASEQMLAFNPEITKANLRADAELQGRVFDDYTAQAPGKMIHELREGPLAKTLELQPDGTYRSALPFAKYYGSVDSTPMFLKLFGRYVDQTGDMQLVRELYPSIEKSLSLMDHEIARGGGYLRYGGGGNEALSNQGWKDSGISIKNSADQLSKAPIALAEPQGYLYEGWRQIAKLEKLLAEQDPSKADAHLARARELEAKAEALKERFNQDFWMADKEFIALALDGTGKQADVVTSNPGHLLATGILSPENAFTVARRMGRPDMNSGFGIRTMASSELPFFANSYHNGPVWLHDFWYWANGAHDLIPSRTAQQTTEALSAVRHFPDGRVPELWGGYGSSEYGIPIPYPRANSPQAWSGGAVLGLLSTNLGLRPQAWANGFEGHLLIHKPVIPEGYGPSVEFNNYRVGDKVVSLRFTKNDKGGADVEVTSNPQQLDIKIIPNDP